MLSLFGVSCSKSTLDNGCEVLCTLENKLTPIKITYVNDQNKDLLFSSIPSLSLDSLYMYYYFDWKELPNQGSKEYPVSYSVEGENPKYLLVYGSPGKEGYFFIRFGNGPIDKIHFKGSLDPTQCCPQNKVDELYQNGKKRSIDRKTGIWKLVK
jgi:hypothetical protein